MGHTSPEGRVDRSLRRLAAATAVGLWLVLLAGFVVTDTRSAEGCGHQWPLCHGKFIPSFALHPLVEYSHRAITGIVGLMVAVLTVWAWRRYRALEARATSGIAALFVVVQSILGAAAVIWPESPPIMALHFGFSLLAFAGAWLLAVWLAQVSRPPQPGRAWRDTPVPKGYARLVGVTMVYLYALVYLGAYVAHANAGLACPDWPLCGAQPWPLTGPAGVDLAHRVGALLAVLLSVALVAGARRFRHERPDVYRGAWATLLLFLAQGPTGAYLVLSRLSMPALLLHVTVVTALFAAVTYLVLQVVPPAAPVRELSASSSAPVSAQQPQPRTL